MPSDTPHPFYVVYSVGGTRTISGDAKLKVLARPGGADDHWRLEWQGKVVTASLQAGEALQTKLPLGGTIEATLQIDQHMNDRTGRWEDDAYAITNILSGLG
jgi:hypothetical protein